MEKEENKGYCSWCLKEINPVLMEKTVLSRDLYKCPECGREIIKCVVCENYARWDTYEVKEEGKKIKHSDHDIYCAEHKHIVANFDTLESDLENPSEYIKVYKKTKKNYAKISKIVLIAIGGSVVLGPLAYFAAPSIGGAIGAYMGYSGIVATNVGLASLGGGALAAGGFGMAGGTIVLTAVGSSVGGALGAYIGSSYFGAVENFEVKEIRKGKNPAIITVNGFLSQRTEGIKNWEESINKLYPNNAWYHVNWEAKRLHDIGKIIATGIGNEAIRYGITVAAKKAAKEAAKKIIPITAVAQIIALGTNPWHVAMIKAEQTGVLLADILKRSKKQKFILLGHSLGARVIYSCLSTLATTSKTNIQEVHLLGGAVDNKIDNWIIAKNPVKKKIYNYYSKNDDVLKYLYKAGTFFLEEPIGRGEIKVKDIKNIDVSEYVKGHMLYKKEYKEYGLISNIRKIVNWFIKQKEKLKTMVKTIIEKTHN